MPIHEELAEAIENLDIPHDGASLAEALALRDRLDARITEVVGAFEAAGGVGYDPSLSVTSGCGPTAA